MYYDCIDLNTICDTIILNNIIIHRMHKNSSKMFCFVFMTTKKVEKFEPKVAFGELSCCNILGYRLLSMSLRYHRHKLSQFFRTSITSQLPVQKLHIKRVHRKRVKFNLLQFCVLIRILAYLIILCTFVLITVNYDTTYASNKCVCPPYVFH